MKPFAEVVNVEGERPIHLHAVASGAVSLIKAKALLASLESAIGTIGKHFACPVPWAVGTYTSTCGTRGSVKIGDQWYCKRHAKKLRPKPSKAALRAARKIAKADAARTLLPMNADVALPISDAAPEERA